MDQTWIAHCRVQSPLAIDRETTQRSAPARNAMNYDGTIHFDARTTGSSK
jgi:hypothetical protein